MSPKVIGHFCEEDNFIALHRFRIDFTDLLWSDIYYAKPKSCRLYTSVLTNIINMMQQFNIFINVME